MTCLTIKEIQTEIKKSLDYQNRILNDINSNKPYSQKKYLKEFNRIIKKDRINNHCYNLQNSNGIEFFANYYLPNNYIISGINHTNYIGKCSPSPF